MSIPFGQRLKAARENANLTQDELAKLVGVQGKQAISNWETGLREPNMQMLLKLSNILERPLNYFFGVESTQKRNRILLFDSEGHWEILDSDNERARRYLQDNLVKLTDKLLEGLPEQIPSIKKANEEDPIRAAIDNPQMRAALLEGIRKSFLKADVQRQIFRFHNRDLSDDQIKGIIDGYKKRLEDPEQLYDFLRNYTAEVKIIGHEKVNVIFMFVIDPEVWGS